MTDSDTLEKALADVRQRRADLQAQYERITMELSKLRMAEASLAAIVEGTPLGKADDILGDLAGSAGGGDGESGRSGKRGSRRPRANSAKGRLRKLLEGAGPQGLTQSEITRRLPDVSPTTLNAYLSGLVSSGEAVRSGDFFKLGDQAPTAGIDEQISSDPDEEDQPEAAE